MPAVSRPYRPAEPDLPPVIASPGEKLPLPVPANKNAQPMAAEPELTWRALVAGCVLGALLAAANVYTALKTGYIDGGSITASVLGFALFRLFSQPYSARENNITQTVAASAAVMSFVAGVAGPIPALARAGYHLSSVTLVAWSGGLAVLGIAVAVALRPRLLGVEKLPFPTGTATAEVIATMSESGAGALRRAQGLALAALAAALIAWLRDGPVALLPQVWAPLGAVLGPAAVQLGFGVSVSPLMFATGMIAGLRAGTSMLIGGVIAWLAIAPRLVASGSVAAADHGALIGWLLWPGVGLVLASSLTALALQWRAIVRGLSDVRSLLKRDGVERSANVREALPLLVLVVIAIAVLVAIAAYGFGIGPGTILLALALSAALAVVCARGAGETDIAPAGDMGGLTQLLFGSRASTASSLACGAMATAQATQTTQTLWAFKAGQRLGADPRAQVRAQLIGAAVGGIVVVPTYEVVVRAYGLGSEKLPAIAVLSWEATAHAVQGGLDALPDGTTSATLIALGSGCFLTLLGRTRWSRYVPSPVALGMGFVMPFAMSVTLWVGAVALALVAMRQPAWTREHAESVAGGAIAGESLFAVAVAILLALGWVG
ncbi:MAG: OPT family oligopeptide transporter [Polyangiales bacterium]